MKDNCTCFPTPPEQWTMYGSSIEPGSMMEPNPDCIEHGWGIRSDTIEQRVMAAIRPQLDTADALLDHYLQDAPSHVWEPIARQLT